MAPPPEPGTPPRRAGDGASSTSPGDPNANHRPVQALAGPAIRIGHVSARVVTDHMSIEEREAVAEWFDDYLSIDCPGFIKTRSMRRAKRVVTTISLFRESTGKFPRGLVPMVLRAARDEVVKAIDDAEDGDAHNLVLRCMAAMTVTDDRKPPCIPAPRETWQEIAPWLFTHTDDRDYRYQGDAVARVVERGCGIMHVPTGGGKTEIAIGLHRVVPCRWLFLVPSKDLLHQAAARFEKVAGTKAGIIGDSKRVVGESFTVATFQTLSRALKAREPWVINLLQSWTQGLIVDECHTLPADSFYAVVMETRRAYWRVGVSATPLARGDRKSVLAIAALGPVIYRVSATELVARGVISMPHVHMLRCEQAIKRPTWQGVYGEGVVRSAARNALLASIAIDRATKPGLLFVKEIDHGKEIEKRLRKAGAKVEFVWGDKSAEVRRAAIRRLEHGDTDWIVTSVVFQTGVDIPCLRSVINGAAGKSTIASIQRVGRGTRRTDDKRDVEIWDIDDAGTRILAAWTKKRVHAYEAEGYPVTHEIG